MASKFVDEFEAAFAARKKPEHTVPGYEHALYMRWVMARLLAEKRQK